MHFHGLVIKQQQIVCRAQHTVVAAVTAQNKYTCAIKCNCFRNLLAYFGSHLVVVKTNFRPYKSPGITYIESHQIKNALL